jgi:hypothetical protein
MPEKWQALLEQRPLGTPVTVGKSNAQNFGSALTLRSKWLVAALGRARKSPRFSSAQDFA